MPGVWDDTWHTCLFDFMFDFWQAAARAHAAGQHDSVSDAMEVVTAALRQCGDVRVTHGVLLSLVGGLAEEDEVDLRDKDSALQQLAVAHLPADCLQRCVMPLVRGLHHRYEPLLVAALQAQHPDVDFTAAGCVPDSSTSALLIKLASLGAVHPAIEPHFLAAIEADYAPVFAESL